MRYQRSLFKLTSSALLSATVALAILALPATAQKAGPATAAGQPINGDSLTKDQFRKLPLNAVIEIQGHPVTKQALIDQFRKTLEARKPPVMSREQVMANFSAAHGKFVQQQQQDLADRKARVYSEATRLTALQGSLSSLPAFQAIDKETKNLLAQYPNASPADKAKIQARARQLHQQLQELHLSVVR